MEHLFKAWPEFMKDVKAAHVLLLADYDGTLTPIAPRPVEAILSVSVREKLARLAQKASFSVGVISGRAIEELKAMVGIKGIYYAGNHGLEIEGPGLRYVNPAAAAGRDIIKGLAGRLAAELDKIQGVIIQDKDLSISVHYRLVAKGEVGRVGEIVKRVTAALRKEGKIVLSPGKKVWEIKPPVDWDKGKAVKTVADAVKKNINGQRLLTIFLGDDVTDEDAFKVIQRPAGWGVYVGPENDTSAAGYCLDSPAEVEVLLDRLVELRSSD